VKALLPVIVLLAVCQPAAAQDSELFERLCLIDDLPACFVRGLMFEMGAGEDTDSRRALEYYRLTCERGYPAGCTGAGLMHQSGRGLPRDPELAASQYRLGCEGGNELGCDLVRALEDERPITAPRPFSTSGWAADAADGDDIEGLLVDVPRLGLQALSDAEGRVSLGRVPEGTYTIRAEAVGYEPVSGVLNVPAYAEVVLLMNRLEAPGGRQLGLVGGVVMDRRQNPVQGVTVELVGTDERPVESGYEGRFTFPNVAPGLARVRVSVPDHEPVETLVIVHGGRAAVIEVTVGPDGVELERPPL
jgi:hypothetical protein